jgi:drug/metabolite transporter (DMT)-like permease
VAATLIYHLVQRATPGATHPLVSLLVTYLASALLPFFPPAGGVRAAFGALNWTSVALALAVVGIEIGFLLAYRAGWGISVAALVVNVIVTVALLPVGVALFREWLSATQIVGLVVCVAGLVLLNRR